MTQRVIGGQTYTLTYDGENHLTGVSGAASATFVYDGDGQRVKATIGGKTTAYLGNYFEWTGSTSTMVKYFYASGRGVAMKKGSTVYFLLSDHLGSTTLTTSSSGAFSAELRYKAWGETRYTSGTTHTQRHFTGQIEESALGLYFYNARWYDPLVGRFTQADSIVPNPGKSSDWDRYSYTRNNPLRYIDPSGHDVCDEEGNCYNAQGWYRAEYAPRLSTTDTWKMMIWGKYGVTMDDDGGKSWDANNLQLIYSSLGNINTSLNGKIKSFSFGATFRLGKYNPSSDCLSCTYSGLTSGYNITFYTIGTAYIHQMNIYHEFGHLVNNHLTDPFTKSDFSENTPSWVDDGYLSSEAYVSYYLHNDPNYSNVQAIQASESGGSEIWADAFANLVVGNINFSYPDGPGSDMFNFVMDTLGIP